MSVQTWWDDFFGSFWSRIQAGGYPEERTTAECDLIASALELARGARVLDIPCGSGRHSIELARRGFQMTGADLRPEHIAAADASAAQAGVSVRFAVSDMREFASEDTFDAAFCYFGSFGYFPEDGDLRFVRAVSNALEPGGRFLVEGHILETLLPIYRERDWNWAGSPADRVRVLEERRWNMETGRVEVTWTLADDRGTRSVDSSIRIYAYRELRALLESAGFVNVHALDGNTGRPFQMGARRALVIGEK